MNPMGPEIKNDWAGEVQHQFTRQTGPWLAVGYQSSRSRWAGKQFRESPYLEAASKQQTCEDIADWKM
jgi:hypothetical protein